MLCWDKEVLPSWKYASSSILLNLLSFYHEYGSFFLFFFCLFLSSISQGTSFRVHYSFFLWNLSKEVMCNQTFHATQLLGWHSLLVKKKKAINSALVFDGQSGLPLWFSQRHKKNSCFMNIHNIASHHLVRKVKPTLGSFFLFVWKLYT